ncbi:MAG: hypothetical protein JRM86_03605 [Nitrososphaerota archaeon]|nr:hypothetical protein [Nitrososphaerota archaeon]
MVGGRPSPSNKERAGIEQGGCDGAILECIETGLKRVLGESAEAATLFFVMSRGNLKREQIPGDPKGFVDAVKMIFGLGATELLRSILKELRSRESGPGWGHRMREFANVTERALAAER